MALSRAVYLVHDLGQALYFHEVQTLSDRFASSPFSAAPLIAATQGKSTTPHLNVGLETYYVADTAPPILGRTIDIQSFHGLIICALTNILSSHAHTRRHIPVNLITSSSLSSSIFHPSSRTNWTRFRFPDGCIPQCAAYTSQYNSFAPFGIFSRSSRHPSKTWHTGW